MAKSSITWFPAEGCTLGLIPDGHWVRYFTSVSAEEGQKVRLELLTNGWQEIQTTTCFGGSNDAETAVEHIKAIAEDVKIGPNFATPTTGEGPTPIDASLVLERIKEALTDERTIIARYGGKDGLSDIISGKLSIINLIEQLIEDSSLKSI